MAFFSHAFDAVLRKRMGVISYGYFLLLAAVVFSPFLIKGAILVGSSDFIDFIYPILMNARRDFLDAKWSFWNPYVLSGVATGNLAFSPQYLPENWILFLLPERLFFAGLTFWSFVKFSGVGFVAFLIFYREVQSRAWALVAATTYMLSGFVLWSLLVDNLSLVFYFTLSLFILWSLKERSLSRSFLSLVFCLYSLLMSSNILYVFYALIALLLLGGYQLKRTLAPRLTGWMTVSSLVTALLLSAVRWIPAIVELAASNRTNGSMESEFSGGGILALRLIIPEIFGVAFPTSIQVLQELSPVFKDGHVNIFAHFPHYFALLPLSLVLFALVSCVRKKIPLFFIVLLLISFALSTRSEPIHTPVRLFLHPIYHGLSMQLFFWVAFCFVLAHAGKGLEESLTLGDLSRESWKGRWLGMFLGLYFVTAAFLLLRSGFNVALVAKGLGVAVLLLAMGWKRPLIRRILAVVLPCLGMMVVVGMLYGSKEIPQIIVAQLFVLSVSVLLLFLFCLCFGRQGYSKVRFVLGIAIFGCWLCLISYPWSKETFVLPQGREVMAIFVLGALRAIFSLLLFSGLIMSFYQGIINRRRAFLTLMVLIVVDLLCFVKVHGDIVMNPFFDGNLFPPEAALKTTAGEDVDKSQYRINRPGLASGSPIYRHFYRDQEVANSMFSMDGIRSYGGQVSAVPNQYNWFLQSLVGRGELFAENRFLNGFTTSLRNERVLDILGVGYAYDPLHKGILKRENALSRWMLFTSYEVQPDPLQALNRLKDPSFLLYESVVLAEVPLIWEASVVSQRARLLTPYAFSSDEMKFHMESKSPALFLFNDSYHSGWQVLVNGKSEPILKANGNFMAFVVPRGRNHIELVFAPYYVALAKRYGLLGIAFAVGFFFFFIWKQPTMLTRTSLTNGVNERGLPA